MAIMYLITFSLVFDRASLEMWDSHHLIWEVDSLGKYDILKGIISLEKGENL